MPVLLLPPESRIWLANATNRAICKLFRPNESLFGWYKYILYIAWPLAAVTLWAFCANKMLPTPVEVVTIVPKLWMQDGLGVEIFTSLVLNLQAVGILVAISLALAYSTVIPFFRPVVAFLQVGRFNGFVGLPIIFALWLRDPHLIKLALLVFAAGVYTVPAIAESIESIPKENYDHAKTLRFGKWRVVYEVTIRGRLQPALDIIRANSAMIWMLVPMVEGLFRSEGGVGALAMNLDKHMNLAAVYAIAIIVSAVGAIQDYGFRYLRNLACPYADLGVDR